MKEKLEKEIDAKIKAAFEVRFPKKYGEKGIWDGWSGYYYPSGSFILTSKQLIFKLLDYLGVKVEHIEKDFKIMKK